MIKFKQRALEEGQPWTKWSNREKESYRKGIRSENARQGKINFCKELLNDPNFQSPLDKASVQAEIDILDNRMDAAEAFMHKMKLSIQAYVEETHETA